MNIALISGLIEGMAARIKIIKSMPREELDNSLEQIIGWCKDIQKLNRRNHS